MNPSFFSLRTRRRSHAASQRGATLIVGLIMLVLITLVVVNAFTLSASNLKSVGNMQVREEAIASANQAIETLISSNFTNALGAQNFSVDINKDGSNDYTVAVAIPICTRALQASVGAPSSIPGMSSGATWTTEWDIAATVTDTASGAFVEVHQGVRVLLSQTQKDSICP